MTSLISVEQFRAELKAKRTPTAGVYRISVDPPVLTSQERTMRFVFSDEAVDRMGDTIAAAGWDVSDFERNPVALWAHDSSAPPIGAGKNVAIEGNRLLGDIEFAPAETYAFADTVYRLLLGRFLRAVSVGFMPTKYVFVDNDPNRGFGIDFVEQSLLEISVCPVPANPNALAEARRKGIDTRPLMEWAERTLDGGGSVMVPRAELERLHKAAKESPVTQATQRRAPSGGKPAGARRSGGAEETDPTAGGAIVGNCGRAADDECGLKDPAECSVHGGATLDIDPDEEKRLRKLLRRLAGRKSGTDGDPEPDDDLPVAHEDAIRLAMKCSRTAKTFFTEAMTHHAKAVDLLGGVVDALDDAGPISSTAPPDDGSDPDGDKAAQLRRAAALKRKHPNV